ncbi:MAG: hypothetical protein U0U46_11510 [Saprospiraceae bacterium]
MDATPFALSGGTPAGGNYRARVSAEHIQPGSGSNRAEYDHVFLHDGNGCSNLHVCHHGEPLRRSIRCGNSGPQNEAHCAGFATLTARGGTTCGAHGTTAANIAYATTTYTVTVTERCTHGTQVITVNPRPAPSRDGNLGTPKRRHICAAPLLRDGSAAAPTCGAHGTTPRYGQPDEHHDLPVTVTLNGCTTTVQQVITVNRPTGAIA